MRRDIVRSMREKQLAAMVGKGRTLSRDEEAAVAERLYTCKPPRPQVRSTAASVLPQLQNVSLL